MYIHACMAHSKLFAMLQLQCIQNFEMEAEILLRTLQDDCNMFQWHFMDVYFET